MIGFRGNFKFVIINTVDIMWTTMHVTGLYHQHTSFWATRKTEHRADQQAFIICMLHSSNEKHTREEASGTGVQPQAKIRFCLEVCPTQSLPHNWFEITWQFANCRPVRIELEPNISHSTFNLNPTSVVVPSIFHCALRQKNQHYIIAQELLMMAHWPKILLHLLTCSKYQIP